MLALVVPKNVARFACAAFHLAGLRIDAIIGRIVQEYDDLVSSADMRIARAVDFHYAVRHAGALVVQHDLFGVLGLGAHHLHDAERDHRRGNRSGDDSFHREKRIRNRRKLSPVKRIAILLILLALVGAFWLGRRQASQQVTELPAVLRQVQAMNQLVTVKYRIQKVVGIEEQKVPFGAEKLLLVVQADVLAGIDLGSLSLENFGVKSKQIAVTLPPAKILHVVIDEKQTKVWDRQVTWWTPWVPYNPDFERQARLVAIDTVKQNATEMGILNDARRNAEAAIRRLLQSLGFEAVTFPT